MLIKTPKNCYIYIPNTGRLYRLDNRDDSVLRFSRIDRTKAMYYNIGAYLFTEGEAIYSYGGYGFWKTNGSLRKFNFKDKEWDIVPLSEEIFAQISPVKVVWYSSTGSRLYVPFQKIVNESLLKDHGYGLFVPDSYVLDLSAGNWKKKGRVTQKFHQLVSDLWYEEPHFQDDTGQLIFKNNQIYWVDYTQNSVRKLNNPLLRQSIERISSTHFRRRYMAHQTLYAYDPTTHKYDSLKLTMNDFNGESFPIWENPYRLHLLWGIFLLFIVSGAGYFLLKYRRRQRLSAPPPSVKLSARMANLGEAERNLLQLLLEKSVSEATASLAEINYVLGLKDKNMGIQKKIRSDLINDINQKFQLVSKEPVLLIQSVRSKTDKRSFEYFIPLEFQKQAKELLRSAK